jgi:hypothetical protein
MEKMDQTRTDCNLTCMAFREKRPVLPERYLHFFRFLLDAIPPRKSLTTFFLEYSTIMAMGTLSATRG